MKVHILAAFLTVSLLWGCGSGSGENSYAAPDNPVAPLPGVDNNTPDNPPAPLPDANIAGITSLSSAGYISVPSYSGSGYYTLLYNTPQKAGDGVDGTVNYTIQTSGFAESGAASRKEGGLTLRADALSGRKAEMHAALRQTEAYLLSSGLSQASAPLRKGPASVSIGDYWNNVNVAFPPDRKINAKCVAISEYAYFFLEDGLLPPDEALLDEYKKGFDAIYPVMHEKFGRENDVDRNGKVIILFFQADDESLLGYFYPADKYPAYMVDDSNEADMFYVNYKALFSDNINDSNNINDVLATLAHEFQHMILFDSRYNYRLEELDTWLNEGLSMQAEFYTGYWDKQRGDYLTYFLHSYPELNLIKWDGTDARSYGYSMVYVRYLAERFGDEVIKRLYKSGHKGVHAVEEAAGMGFNDIFKDFALAVFISGRGLSDDPRYNFTTLDIPRSGGLRIVDSPKAGTSLKNSVKPYGMRLIYWPGTVTGVTLEGDVKGYGASLE